MQQIETAFRNWLLKFAPFVFAEGQFFDDPNNELYPRITYSANIGESLENAPVRVILYDWSFSDSRIWEMHEKINKAVPPIVGTSLIIPAESYLEYRNPNTGAWSRFELNEFQDIADRFAPTPIEWRRIEGGKEEQYAIWRDTTYSQPYPQDERLSRARLLRLHTRNRTSL